MRTARSACGAEGEEARRLENRNWKSAWERFAEDKKTYRRHG